MAVLVLESSQFMSLGGTRGKGSVVFSDTTSALTVVLPDRAVCTTALQPSRRVATTHVMRSERNNRSTVKGTRGIGSLPQIPTRPRPENEILVDAIFSAHSDGVMVILRKA